MEWIVKNTITIPCKHKVKIKKQTKQTKEHFPIPLFKVQRYEAQILPRAGRNKNCTQLIYKPSQTFGQQTNATSLPVVFFKRQLHITSTFLLHPVLAKLKLPRKRQSSAKQIDPGTANMRHRDTDTRLERVLWFGAGKGQAANASAESQG